MHTSHSRGQPMRSTPPDLANSETREARVDSDLTCGASPKMQQLSKASVLLKKQIYSGPYLNTVTVAFFVDRVSFIKINRLFTHRYRGLATPNAYIHCGSI